MANHSHRWANDSYDDNREVLTLACACGAVKQIVQSTTVITRPGAQADYRCTSETDDKRYNKAKAQAIAAR